jgi:hypothetical protein
MMSDDIKNSKAWSVFITTCCGGKPYFRASKTLISDASSPFRAEMLSANRQLIAILGLLLPTYLIKSMSLRTSGGRSW